MGSGEMKNTNVPFQLENHHRQQELSSALLCSTLRKPSSSLLLLCNPGMGGARSLDRPLATACSSPLSKAGGVKQHLPPTAPHRRK